MDRYFLERVVTRITELSHGATYSYEATTRVPGAEGPADAHRAQAPGPSPGREAQWIMRGARARGTKSKERIQRYHASEPAPETPRLERVRPAAG